ncbi:quinone-dependent dihydroorotate dehydrogenase [Pararhizobium sp. IMCC21322]|uniref:quinone-dependent dihydroorotate dehydrogenase n=1 Tax=Pararhizobium sp. IMCC21322 TaxID=3067903 RepID=UPI0027429BDE|nr:quinone-dependent dihydroorotate dehydrogenase [Pararhizobium sp. IMCC21322]
MSAFLQIIAQRGLKLLGPELAHDVSIKALRSGLFPKSAVKDDPRLAVQILGQRFPNPIGMAAGFDKNALVYNPLLQMGFGFAEAGTVTPLAQSGNASPRAFRLRDHEAIINRYGFNNEGMEAFEQRLQETPPAGILGINVGANKNTEDKAADYAACIRKLAPLASYITVNISSPNTPGLRALQVGDALDDLLARVVEARDEAVRGNLPKPLLLKIAPDVSEHQLDAIVHSVARHRLEGMIVSNTTLDRSKVKDARHAKQAGGLSGAPLFDRATILLAKTRERVGPLLPIIGVGGISTGAQGLQKLEAGANLIQLYTGMVYHGLPLLQDIKAHMVAELDKQNVSRVSVLTGSNMREWAAKSF